MTHSLHDFSIPVMGTGHSIDSPIRVAPYGIHSVMSIVDDLLVEKIRKYYCEMYDLPYKNIPRSAKDGRAERITAYLNTVQEVVQKKFESVKKQPFFEDNDKAKYFRMLPDSNILKKKYQELLQSRGDKARQLSEELTRRMQPGSIDVNIMAKVDKLNLTKSGEPMSAEYSDGSAALRGYAQSNLSSSLVLSAGFNPRLYNYLAEFQDFYRDKAGDIKKKIILKVSDFRSALIQGKYLAKKGLEVFEYRIESGLNCGGHAFATEGELLPVLLKEFREKKQQLRDAIQPLVEKFYTEERGGFKPDWNIKAPRITVQGGIGTHGEMQRLLNDFEMDGTGWGSPFLLVPEATTVDSTTRMLLKNAGEQDVYLSGVSPLGVPFNNVRNTGSHQWHQERIEKGKPGSPCPKGFLKSNTEFTENPICTASTQYQLLKIDQIEQSDYPGGKKERLKAKVLNKACLCDHLANGALIQLGIQKESRSPQAICPGPNIAWFDGEYSLEQMVDHIYGRGDSLVSDERPHMFAKEITLYVDYLQDLIDQEDADPAENRKLVKFRKNLEAGMDFCLEIAGSPAYEGENLASIPKTVHLQKQRLERMFREAAEPVVASE